MRILMTVLAGCVFAAGCDTTTTPPAQRQWQATLAGQASFPGVSGAATVNSTASGFTATATINGATAAAVHPWHVHVGTCATDGPIFGPAEAYAPLAVGANGSATQTATVNTPLQVGQQYFVNVHASPTDLATIVACGDLVLQ
jgi:hypothetical protein